MPDRPDVDLDGAMLEVLRQRMTDHGLSAVALAATAGVSRPTLARKLAQGGAFTLQEWDHLARALDDDLDVLIEEARQLLRQTRD